MADIVGQDCSRSPAVIHDFSARELRDAFGSYPTGVAVMSGYRLDGAAVAITASSFVSVSLDPPLMAWCLSNNSPSLSAFVAKARFAVTILGASHEDVALRFASRAGRNLDSRNPEVDDDTPPVIEGGICRLDCVTVSVAPAGDHQLIMGEVLQLRKVDGTPLVFHGGRFGRLSPKVRAAPLDIWAHFGDAWSD